MIAGYRQAGRGRQKSRQRGASVHYNGPYDCIAMKRVITAQDVPAAGELRVPIGTLVTPSAREVAEGRGVRIVELPEDQLSALAPPEKTIAMGADHGGYLLKEALKPILEGLGLEVRDVGVNDEKPADYPDLALKVAELVAAGTAARGVVIDGAGIGSSIAANKVPGIRAALCYDKASARNSREHNDSNVLTLGARLLTQTQAEEVLRTWIGTPFAGGRHQARVQKILDIERKYLRKDPS
jgi:ribose 5-phosphate isomerase B